MGCDIIGLAREPDVGAWVYSGRNAAFRAQRCHSVHCPTGVATQNRWLANASHRRGGMEATLYPLRRGATTIWGQPRAPPTSLPLDNLEWQEIRANSYVFCRSEKAGNERI
ncbi:MAG: hypothetical protein M2R45_01527 [Verrucomicrobia subdivision 3 bacterium]|nr:hypothetical protein [Limisphaerales bacterium]MCS1413345.1 hypothetical protein [Limisphaerales bacterium]